MESVVSIYENRQSKKRTPTDDRSNHEMLIAFNFNGPSLAKLYIVLESAPNKYFRVILHPRQFPWASKRGFTLSTSGNFLSKCRWTNNKFSPEWTIFFGGKILLPIHTGINTKASVIASIYFAHYGSKHRHLLLVSRSVLTGFTVLQVLSKSSIW